MCVLKRANGQLSREAKVVREPKTRESQGNTVLKFTLDKK